MYHNYIIMVTLIQSEYNLYIQSNIVIHYVKT